MFSLLTTLFFSLYAIAYAAPSLVKRIVVDPPITSPDASTVWTVGSTVTVTWSVYSPPVRRRLCVLTIWAYVDTGILLSYLWRLKTALGVSYSVSRPRTARIFNWVSFLTYPLFVILCLVWPPTMQPSIDLSQCGLLQASTLTSCAYSVHGANIFLAMVRR